MRDRVLVHIDAHHDMWWFEKPTRVHIANYIASAIRERLVKEVVWVVPDPSWDSQQSRKNILRHVKKLNKSYPGKRSRLRANDENIAVQLSDCSLNVCPLRRLPKVREQVLLDIDVDFFLIPRVSFWGRDVHSELPWLWPQDLIRRLQDAGLSADLVTVAYSVEGGYTPLQWKYLGDQLLLGMTGQTDGGWTAGREMQMAACAIARGDLHEAEEALRQADRLWEGSAAPSYALARLYAKMGSLEEARGCYRRALQVDPAYRTAYNSSAIALLDEKRFDEAERECRRVLLLDPDDAYAQLALARIAMVRKRWTDAEVLLRSVLLGDSGRVDAHRLLGEVTSKMGRYDDAIEAYEHSLQLTLAGHKSLQEPIVTEGENALPSDVGHGTIHARLAQLYARKGELRQAIAGYRISITAGHDGPDVHLPIVVLYARDGQWRRARQHALMAVRRLPGWLVGWVRYKVLRPFRIAVGRRLLRSA